MRGRLLAALLVAAPIANVFPARPAPPEGPLPYREWFEGLRQPGTGMPCCSIADCRPVNYRPRTDGGDGFEVELPGHGWRSVPAARVLQQTRNPTGRGVACWDAASGLIHCFVRAWEG